MVAKSAKATVPALRTLEGWSHPWLELEGPILMGGEIGVEGERKCDKVGRGWEVFVSEIICQETK